MLIVQDKIISEDVIEKAFICNLNACKGACCWEGDFGAPLEMEEIEKLNEIIDEVRPYLSQEGLDVIKKKGVFDFYKEENEFGTPLLENGACAFMTKDEKGHAQCGIEQAYNDGKVNFKKPISCHLYPIRVTELPEYDALNYDRWDICSAACTLGEKEQVPVYRFLKEALIRKYGDSFYEELEAAATFYLKNK